MNYDLSDDGVQALDARLNLKCDKHLHPITQLWQTSPGVEPQVIEHGRIKPFDHDHGIFDRPCRECGNEYGRTMMYGRAAESLRQKLSEVPRGTIGEWTLVYCDVNADT
ncbi:hypothetical protein A5692_23490 [Mycobacterium sp. E342]|uniref:hypothetical protein n=1 Tax=Mycobacterium sp. E342 TaxID=1834147 RepID=UPI0007FCCD02|nr:hypothetical protein [Mycobacterium sp. E342]OBH28055.1 hypothetical protein A5692_23490 [Mycobacterium sp. E342]